MKLFGKQRGFTIKIKAWKKYCMIISLNKLSFNFSSMYILRNKIIYFCCNVF